MTLFQRLAVGCVLTTTGVLARGSVAASYSLRQYDATWHQSQDGQYYYREYYFKPRLNYVGYRHHYVIYFPQRPKHYYFYNPYKKVYWGRCPVETNGDGRYSMLTDSARPGNLQAIRDAAFPSAYRNAGCSRFDRRGEIRLAARRPSLGRQFTV
jgi:hypothetical protein